MSLFSDKIDPAIKHAFMREAIAEARKSTLRPTVGAVVVRDNKIIGRGHRKVERLREAPPLWRVTHAEQDVLLRLGRNANGAVLFVTLEPCAGRYQGPTVETAQVCSLLIPRSGIATVVIGLVDQDPMTFGDGLRQLSKAGVRLEYFYHGLEEDLVELIGDGQFGRLRFKTSVAISKWISKFSR